jgi:hypothetical protein
VSDIGGGRLTPVRRFAFLVGQASRATNNSHYLKKSLENVTGSSSIYTVLHDQSS